MNSESSKTGFLRSGAVATATGVSSDTLRHYERIGVIAKPRRSPNGYREYPAETIERVRLVQRALAFGFTLDELARLFKVRKQGGAPCQTARELAAEKLADVEKMLGELVALRDGLQALLVDWDARLNQTLPGERAALLESLADQAPHFIAARKRLRKIKSGKERLK